MMKKRNKEYSNQRLSIGYDRISRRENAEKESQLLPLFFRIVL